MPRILDALARLMPGWPQTRAEEKASAVGALIAFETLGRPVWTPRDYAAFAREGFMQNAIVYRSVRMIAEAAATIPLLLYEREEEIEEHPFLDLMRNPSADHTGTDLLEAWYGFLLVSGNAYVEAVAVGGRLRELHALRPDRMRVVPGPDGWPEAYEYSAGGRTVRFDTEPVPGVRPILHVKLFHPANDHYGLSPIEAAANAIDIHNTAGSWNKALLDNSARPSGALVYSGGMGRMTSEQFDRLKSELETSYQGAKHAGRPLLLEGGLDWKSLSLSPKDMDFIEAKNAAAREIALALGVPPMLLGIPGDNTYSNYQEAQRALWRNTVLPLVNRTAKALSNWLSPAWGVLPEAGQQILELRPDLDSIEALSSEREALWARLERSSFLTQNEKRAAAGYGPHGEGESLGPAAAGIPIGLKFSPDQPRVSAGHSDGGQWTDGGGGGRIGGGGNSGGLTDSRILSDATPDNFSKPGTRLAQNDSLSGYPVDLREEESRGGHAIEQHVKVSHERLKSRVKHEADRIIDRGDDFEGLSIGSFSSLEAATKLVNASVAENQELVEDVVSGRAQFAILNSRFKSVTGYEVYLERYHSQPYIRETYGTRVFILRDPGSKKKYRVQSTFPVQ